jgi:hypothetical protein
VCIGYLLAHERVLEEHLGTRFSIDHGIDQRRASAENQMGKQKTQSKTKLEEHDLGTRFYIDHGIDQRRDFCRKQRPGRKLGT